MLGREHEFKALRVESLSLLSTAGTPQTLESPLLIRGKAERRSLRRDGINHSRTKMSLWYSYQQDDDLVINNLPHTGLGSAETFARHYDFACSRLILLRRSHWFAANKANAKMGRAR